MKETLKILILFFVTMLAVSAGGCEYNFDPIKESDYYFSMYGVLDLNADTQWVRVTPVRDSLLSSARSIDAEVTLRRERTGETVALNDSLFEFIGGVRDTARFWNFWTTYSLRGNEEYTIRAEASDGRWSEATITIPPAFPVPVVQNYDEALWVGTVTGSGINRMVVAETVYRVEIEVARETFKVSQIEKQEVTVDQNGNFQITIDDRYYAIQEYGGSFTNLNVLDASIVIASGNKSWPDIANFTEEEVVLPDIFSNVENGLGVVAGIASVTIPLEVCRDGEGEVTACPPRPKK